MVNVGEYTKHASYGLEFTPRLGEDEPDADILTDQASTIH